MTISEMNALAIYNAEVSRGIAHTEEYDQRMARLQAEWNEGMKSIKNPSVFPPFFVKPE